MATISTINIGNIVNDGLGDDLRTAFQKVNANFATLNNDLTITASNLGTVGETVFKQKSGLNLEFRKLVAGNKITITSSPDSLLISSTIGNVFQRLTTNSGYVDADDHQYVTFQGDANIQVTAVEDVITVGTTLDLNQILTVMDFGPMNNSYTSIVQMNTAASNFDFAHLNDTFYDAILSDLSTWQGWEDILFKCFIGWVYGMAYVLFELPNSWLKRRVGIAPGATATRGAVWFTLLDKTDSALGVSLVFCVLRDFSWSDALLFFVTASALHFLFSWILYLRKIKKAF